MAVEFLTLRSIFFLFNYNIFFYLKKQVSVAGHENGWLVLSARLRLEARLWFKKIKVAFEFDPSRSSQIPESPVNMRIFTFLSIQSSIIFFFHLLWKKKNFFPFSWCQKKKSFFSYKNKNGSWSLSKKIMCFFVSDIYLVVQLIGKKKKALFKGAGTNTHPGRWYSHSRLYLIIYIMAQDQLVCLFATTIDWWQ